MGSKRNTRVVHRQSTAVLLSQMDALAQMLRAISSCLFKLPIFSPSGDSFMRRYYTTFNYEKQTVGLALAA